MNLTRTNQFTIIGILESVNIIKGNSPKVGNYIRGDLVIKVQLPREMSIPVTFFAAETITKDGKTMPRKLHSQLEGLRQGTRISVTGNIEDNKFWSPASGQLIRTDKLKLNFINTVKAEDMDKAEFEFSGFVAEALKEKFNKDGELEAYVIRIGQSDYRGTRAEIITFSIDKRNNSAVTYVEREYTINKTVKVYGNLDYDVKTDIVEETVEFGKPNVKTYQRNIKNLIITSGALVTEGVYEDVNIQSLLAGDETHSREVEQEAKSKEQTGASVSEKKPAVAQSGFNSSLL